MTHSVTTRPSITALQTVYSIANQWPWNQPPFERVSNAGNSLVVEIKTASALAGGTVRTILARLRAILIAAAVAVLFASTPWTIQVRGQSPATPAIQPAPRINLTSEQEFIIREIVLKDLNVPKAKPDAPETVGDVVPENVELYPIPPEVAEKVPQVKSHKFFVKDNKVILVSSSDRLIADVIQKAK